MGHAVGAVAAAGIGPGCWFGLDSGKEAQVEGGGDLDGLQGEGGGVEGEGDRIDHFSIHEELGALRAVSQASLKGTKDLLQ